MLSLVGRPQLAAAIGLDKKWDGTQTLARERKRRKDGKAKIKIKQKQKQKANAAVEGAKNSTGQQDPGRAVRTERTPTGSTAQRRRDLDCHARQDDTAQGREIQFRHAAAAARNSSHVSHHCSTLKQPLFNIAQTPVCDYRVPSQCNETTYLSGCIVLSSRWMPLVLSLAGWEGTAGGGCLLRSQQQKLLPPASTVAHKGKHGKHGARQVGHHAPWNRWNRGGGGGQSNPPSDAVAHLLRKKQGSRSLQVVRRYLTRNAI